MSFSLILTHHAAVQMRFEREYETAADLIWPFEKLVWQIALEGDTAYQPFTLVEKRLFLKNMRKAMGAPAPLDSDQFLSDFFSQLKTQWISPSKLHQAVESYPFSVKKRAYYAMVARWFEAYEKKKGWSDYEDLLNISIRSLSKSQSLRNSKPPKSFVADIEKILLLAHDLTDLEHQFLSVLNSKVPELERVSLVTSWGEDAVVNLEDGGGRKKKLFVIEAETPEDEVEAMAQAILEMARQKMLYKDMCLFCFDTETYVPLFRMIFQQKNIPFCMWDEIQNQNGGILIAPWHPNTLILGNMKRVFVAGLSHSLQRATLVTEEEKAYFNEVFGEPVFLSYRDECEKLKASLQWLAVHSIAFFLSYTGEWVVPFQEFLSDYRDYSLKQVRPQKPSIQKPSPPSFLESVTISADLFRQHQEVLLPKVYSVRSLSQFQKCPYGFFIKECLKFYPVKPIPGGGMTKGLSPLQEGEFLHYVLWRYFSMMRDKGFVESPLFHKLLEECFVIFEERFKVKMLSPDRFRLERTLLQFIEKEKEWRSERVPKAFEWSFGSEGKEERDPLSVSETLNLYWNGMALHCRGKVDRVDSDARSKTFQVIDYKTGHAVPSEKEIKSGKHFQVPLYAMAVEALLLPGYWPKEAYFYNLTTLQKKRAFVFQSQEEWEGLKEKTLREIFSLMAQIKTFSFPGTPNQCYSTCELSAICSAVQ